MTPADLTVARELARHLGEAVPGMSILFTCGEARARSALLNRLADEVEALQQVHADSKRLAREIDGALTGLEGMAQQASLCDLVEPARALREKVERLERDAARWRRFSATGYPRAVIGSSTTASDGKIIGWNVMVNGVLIRHETAEEASDAGAKHG